MHQSRFVYSLRRNDKFFIIPLFLLIGRKKGSGYDGFSIKTRRNPKLPKTERWNIVWQIRKISDLA